LNNKIWTVYCHTNKTNGKKYIGCTSKRPNQRYGKNGVEYIRAKQKFGQAIEKYGWDGFHHDILAQVDSEEEAEELVDRFRNEITSFLSDDMKKLNAIRCTLIAVDMILDIKLVYKDNELYDYWHEIQQELEKLTKETK